MSEGVTSSIKEVNNIFPLEQVRFCMKFLSGQKQLPSKKEMLRETEEEMEKRWAKGYKKRQAHLMGPDQVKKENRFVVISQ